MSEGHCSTTIQALCLLYLLQKLCKYIEDKEKLFGRANIKKNDFINVGSKTLSLDQKTHNKPLEDKILSLNLVHAFFMLQFKDKDLIFNIFKALAI